MNYIGSKLSLIDFIKNSILNTIYSEDEKKSNSELVFADLFAGTGAIGTAFKKMDLMLSQTISNIIVSSQINII